MEETVEKNQCKSCGMLHDILYFTCFLEGLHSDKGSSRFLFSLPTTVVACIRLMTLKQALKSQVDTSLVKLQLLGL